MAEPPTCPPDKPVVWMGSSLQAVREFPADVKREVGFALDSAQKGRKHPSAKPLTGDDAFKGASVLEIVEDDVGSTYRAVYTVRFAGSIYVLHAFQKKSKKGIATPRQHIATIKRRLIEARSHYEKNVERREAG